MEACEVAQLPNAGCSSPCKDKLSAHVVVLLSSVLYFKNLAYHAFVLP